MPFKPDLGFIQISQWAQEVVCGARAVSPLEERCARKAGQGPTWLFEDRPNALPAP